MKAEARFRRRLPRSRLMRAARATLIDPLRAVARWRDRNQLWDIIAMTAWLREAAGPQDLLVSVILPTRNRAQLLPRAVDSVVGQIHERWELIVVDDMSTDQTRETIAAYPDRRIRMVNGAGRGPAPARNAGLAVAHGAVVAYLDDDNLLDPLWLRGVAWAFTHRPDAGVLYGARVTMRRSVRGLLVPDLQFPRYRRWWLLHGNFVDISMIAHRRELVGAQFDEAIPPPHEDWDLFLRITRNQAPVRLPIISTYYFTDTTLRRSDLNVHEAEYRTPIRSE